MGSPSYAEEQGGGALGDGWVLLRRFRASVDDPGLGYSLNLTLCAHLGHLAVEEAVISRRSGLAPLSSTGLRRVALDSYAAMIRRELVRVAGGLLVVRVREEGELPGTGGSRRYVTFSPGVPDAWGDPDVRRRRHSPDEIVRRVASAYLAALKDPERKHRATAVVAEQFGYSRAHVGRLLVRARRPPYNLLGPACKGRAGEQVRPRWPQEEPA